MSYEVFTKYRKVRSTLTSEKGPDRTKKVKTFCLVGGQTNKKQDDSLQRISREAQKLEILLKALV